MSNGDEITDFDGVGIDGKPIFQDVVLDRGTVKLLIPASEVKTFVWNMLLNNRKSAVERDDDLCPYCFKYRTADKEEYTVHMYLEHPDALASRIQAMRSHLVVADSPSAQGPEPFPAPAPLYTETATPTAPPVVQPQMQNDPLACPACNFYAKTPVSLKVHITRIHKE
jgi:hypothetical protein